MVKQRIYGFLLRRILGPYLSTASLEKLHNSIDIAISEGKFILKDVDLDCTYLNTLIVPNADKFSVQKATVKKLAIFISLRNSQTNNNNSNNNNNNAEDESSWQSSISKMYRLGYGEGDPNKTGGASLHVHIEFEGIEIELAPLTPTERTSLQDQIASKQTNKVPDDKGKAKSTTSFVGSYIEAALNSLRLSFNITDVSVRFNSALLPQESPQHYIQLKVATVSYRDIYRTSGTTKKLHNEGNVICIPEIILHKEITFYNVSVVVGTRESGKPTIALTHDEVAEPFNIERSVLNFHGIGNIQVHIASYPTESTASSQQSKKKTQLKREINIALKESIHVEIDRYNIFTLKRVLDSLAIVHNEQDMDQSPSQNQNLDKKQEILNQHDDNHYRDSLLATEDDILNNVENELGLLRNIVGDYDGRRGLDDEIRTESNNYTDTSLEQSFDAFFDANDLGFSHYQSVLASCHNLKDSDGDDNIIHTKLSLDLQEISTKIFTRRNFPGISPSSGNHHHHLPNLEARFIPVDNNMYTELVLRGCELTSSISKDKCSITSSISYLDLKECSRKFIQHTFSGIDIPLHSTSLIHFEEVGLLKQILFFTCLFRCRIS